MVCRWMGGIVAAAAVTGPAAGQSINVDFGVKAGVPQPTYAAAGSAGTWNAVSEPGTPLVGLDAQPTTILVDLMVQTAAYDDPGPGGDDAALLIDGLPGLGDVMQHVTFTGLQPGRYRLITYAWTPGEPGDTTLVAPYDDFAVGLVSGGPWPGQLQEGVTHVVHEIVTASGTLAIGFGGGVWGHVGFLNAVQLERRCAADTNVNQIVDVDDLMGVIQDWGPCAGCSTDVNSDGTVDVDDLLEVILSWGPCPGSAAALCHQTDGVWDPLSCGHYSCGDPPDCDAVIPGCDCGPGRNFVEGVGCVEDDACP